MHKECGVSLSPGHPSGVISLSTKLKQVHQSVRVQGKAGSWFPFVISLFS